MHKALRTLYESCPKLTDAYIRDVLGLHDHRASKVAEITGGISQEEAEMLCEVVTDVAPIRSLEVGLGYGFSTIAICGSSDQNAPERKHIVIDPHQSKYWNGLGLKNLSDAGYGNCVEFHEQPSYRCLPELERGGTQLDFAFVDGWHTFDYVFVDFFYIDKMLREGGVVAFDDADWPSIRTVIRYIVTNLPYRIYRTMPEKRPREPIDVELGIEGSCIALMKQRSDSKREIFFHKPFF
jgi:predicted O-methyltransferase YrrM